MRSCGCRLVLKTSWSLAAVWPAPQSAESVQLVYPHSSVISKTTRMAYWPRKTMIMMRTIRKYVNLSKFIEFRGNIVSVKFSSSRDTLIKLLCLLSHRCTIRKQKKTAFNQFHGFIITGGGRGERGRRRGW